MPVEMKSATVTIGDRASRVLREFDLPPAMSASLQQLMVYQLGTHCPSGELLRDQAVVQEGMEAALRAEVQRAMERVLAGQTAMPEQGEQGDFGLPIVSLEGAQAPEPVLASLPPNMARALLPSGSACVWQVLFAERPVVQATLACFAQVPAEAQAERAPAYVQVLCEELQDMASTLQEAEPIGWSMARDYDELSWAQKLWLDPRRAHLPAEGEFRSEWQWMGWTDVIGEQCAQWLEAQAPCGSALAQAARALDWGQVLLGNDASAWAAALTQQFRDRATECQLTF